MHRELSQTMACNPSHLHTPNIQRIRKKAVWILLFFSCRKPQLLACGCDADAHLLVIKAPPKPRCDRRPTCYARPRSNTLDDNPIGWWLLAWLCDFPVLLDYWKSCSSPSPTFTHFASLSKPEQATGWLVAPAQWVGPECCY